MVPPEVIPVIGRAVAIMGATATGKSELALDLAERFGGEILSMDSRQVYRGMDIGTAKVPPEERRGILHHLIDIRDPREAHDAATHARLAREAYRTVLERRRLPIFVGGTGFYFRALFEGLAEFRVSPESLAEVRRSLRDLSTEALYRELQRVDPERTRQLSPRDRVRIARAIEIYRLTGIPISEHFRRQRPVEPIPALRVVLTMPRWDLRARIARRTRAMFQAGWVEEVERLLRQGVRWEDPGMQSLGYPEIRSLLEGREDWESVIERVIRLTQQYAKRQETFFRGMGDAWWVDVTEPGARERVFERVAEFVEKGA
jgi:tRNA dimethylallyltransferase